jgi:hypothetical protein
MLHTLKFAVFTFLSVGLSFGEFLEIDTAGNFKLHGEKFIIKGFNYYPSNYGWCAMELWDTTEIKTELEKAVYLGANTIRFFVDYSFSVDSTEELNKVDSVESYHLPTPQYINSVKTFLNLLGQYQLKAIVTLFDYMPGWAYIDNGGSLQWAAKAYIAELTSHLKNDTNIAVYDILNEGDNLVDTTDSIPSFDDVLKFYREMADTLNKLDTNHLITAGFCNIEFVEHTKDFVDFISFHYFDDPNCLGPKIRDLKNTINPKQPVVLEEIGYTSFNKEILQTHAVWTLSGLDICLNYENLNGVMIWTLTDFNDPTVSRTHGIPGNVEEQKRFGVFNTDLSEKHHASAIRKYFTGQNTINNRLTFKYSKIRYEPDSADAKCLGVAVRDVIKFYDSDSLLLDSLLIGTPQFNKLQGCGWYYNETWNPIMGQWMGNLDSITNLYMNFPGITKYFTISLDPEHDSTELIISYDTELLDSIMVRNGAHTYTIPGPRVIPVKEMLNKYHGLNNFKPEKAEVFNLRGQKINIKFAGNKPILSGLPMGIYLIRMSNQERKRLLLIQ